MKKAISIFIFFQLAISHLVCEEKLSFNFDVRPILASNCYDCHGPDEEGRKGDLRLDIREEALHVLKKDGDFIHRITTKDVDDIMPPPTAHKDLSQADIDLLIRWINEGATYEPHWAFVTPTKSPLPKVKNKDWPLNEIDYFILSKIENQHLTPSKVANKTTLLRRLYLDLIGIPPTAEQIQQFLSDESTDAYDKVVTDLLNNPSYGIRWARPWLDLARYADTNGYEKDRVRTIWPYRDWVIDALNKDMPYDQFSIEQLAGDMLDSPSSSQMIATGFHRNTMVNEEGGIDPLEYRHLAMVDRVATTGTIWMGLTIGCAQCHTHKYDPITHTDYHSFMALLNNTDEPDFNIPDPNTQQKLIQFRKQKQNLITQEYKNIKNDNFKEWKKQLKKEHVAWTTMKPISAEADLPHLSILKDHSILANGDFTKREIYKLKYNLNSFNKPITALRLDALPHESLPDNGPGMAFYEGRKGDFFLSELTAKVNGVKQNLINASLSYGSISVGRGQISGNNVLDGEGSTGWSTSKKEGEAHHLVVNLETPLSPKGDLEIELLFERHFVAALGHFKISCSTDEKQAKALPKTDLSFDIANQIHLKDLYIKSDNLFIETQKKLEKLKKPKYLTTLVMKERPAINPRPTHLHHRGEYASPKEIVKPAVPAVFPQIKEAAPNRLSFSRWLVSDKNPLAARVAVNRTWQVLFGKGILKTVDDFGTQTAPPSHPKLLDWLAVHFVEKKWSMKELHRTIVSSATYRQSSVFTQVLKEQDPNNLLYARASRLRLDAEVIRDSALAASGLLSHKMKGPGVYPPQPASVMALAYGNAKWNASKGEDRYRRSLYTFTKRTAPFAAFTSFDAPTGESCIAKRERSNTPLQALTLLNDDMFLEMSQALANKALKETTLKKQLDFIFQSCTSRFPNIQEYKNILDFYQAQLKRFSSQELKKEVFLKENLSLQLTPELAALTLLARVVINLDESVSKR